MSKTFYILITLKFIINTQQLRSYWGIYRKADGSINTVTLDAVFSSENKAKSMLYSLQTFTGLIAEIYLNSPITDQEHQHTLGNPTSAASSMNLHNV